MNLRNYLLWLVGIIFALIFGPLSLATPAAAAEAAPIQPSFTYGEGITAEEFYRDYHQTICYDFMVIKGSLENAVGSGLVAKSNGLYYATNAGVSWGDCPTTIDGAPDYYVTACTERIGDMHETYGWDQVRGWITDANGTVVTYLVHSTDVAPCDAGAVPIFDDSVYPDWQAACEFGPVLFVMNGANARCDANPITAGTP